jgi:hypothetical protein
VIGPALPDREKLDVEIARLRDFNVGQLRSRWHTAFGRNQAGRVCALIVGHLRGMSGNLTFERFGV